MKIHIKKKATLRQKRETRRVKSKHNEGTPVKKKKAEYSRKAASNGKRIIKEEAAPKKADHKTTTNASPYEETPNQGKHYSNEETHLPEPVENGKELPKDVQTQKNNLKYNQNRNSSSSHRKRGSGIHTARVIGTGTALRQMEGGEEVLTAARIGQVMWEPITSTSEKAVCAGRKIYREQAEKKLAEKHIKKSDKAKRIKKKVTDTAKNKAVKVTAEKAGKETAKKGTKKATKAVTKKAAKTTAQVAGAAAGTALTGVGGVAVGAVAGEIAGIKLDKQDVKKSSRNRMIQLFAAKLRQEENQDNLGKALKDVVKMKLSMAMKYAIKYIGLFLLCLFAIVAVIALPVIIIIAVIYNSPLAIFFPSISHSGETTQQVLSAYVAEFNQEVDWEYDNYSGYHDREKIYIDYEGAGMPDNYYDILTVYMVRYGNGDTATDMTQQAKQNLKKVFDDMCSYHITTGTKSEVDEEGEVTVYTIKYVNVTLKTSYDMIPIYGFSEEERAMLSDIMRPEYLSIIGGTGEEGEWGHALDESQYQAIVDAISDANGKQVVEFALSKVGYPYSQDYRDSGNYYDCSSLAYYAWKNAGVSILYQGSNTAASEGKYCHDNNYLVKYEEMQPGDLIFYSYANNGRFMNISHVAIYAGDGMVVEAANSKLGVVYRRIPSPSSIVFIGRPR